MKIEIKQMSNGVWRVGLGLIEQNFLTIETALEWVKMKMDDAEASWLAGMQNTSGT